MVNCIFSMNAAIFHNTFVPKQVEVCRKKSVQSMVFYSLWLHVWLGWLTFTGQNVEKGETKQNP